jgi:hypothetical protein
MILVNHRCTANSLMGIDHTSLTNVKREAGGLAFWVVENLFPA